ncbi:putative electron transport protein [Escherichia coli]|uniref:Putative electron transport protein n=1 Tax=Escherichia coli TaxID=562 RepID=A0A377ASV1_ECOLX|nr:putative electron transport protein [Escherichia coli]
MAEKKRTRWQRRPGTTGGKLTWNDWRNATTWRKATQLLLLAMNILYCHHVLVLGALLRNGK